MKVPSVPRSMGWLATVVVVATLGMALWIVGSPSSARQAAADRTRINSLQFVQSEVNSYFTNHKALPKSLSEIDLSSTSPEIRDPVTNEPIEYKTLDSRRYRLCVNFETDTRQQKTGSWDEFSKHPKGRFCFELSAN
jgi:hypothetical protein